MRQGSVPRHAAAKKSVSRLWPRAGVATAVSCLTIAGLVNPAHATTSVSFQYSMSSNRSAPTDLSGATVAGKIYAFAVPSDAVTSVSFWIDNTSMSGTPSQVEKNAPYDLAGGSATVANPFDTTKLSDGTHSLTVKLALSAGGTFTASTGFTVKNSTTTAPPPSPAPSPSTSTSPPPPSPTPAPPTVSGTHCLTSPHVCGYPDATNTGVPAGTSLTKSGSVTVTQNGAVISNLDVTGSITVKANNVTIKDTRVTFSGTSGYAIRLPSGYSNLFVEDSEINGSGTATADYYGGVATFLRVNAWNSNDGIKITPGMTVRDSYFHDLARVTGCHCDSMQANNGGANITIVHNTILPYKASTQDPFQSAFITSQVASALVNFVYTDNLLDGGNYTIYCNTLSGTSQLYARNRFGRDFRYGPKSGCGTSGVVWQNNVWDDNGQPLN